MTQSKLVTAPRKWKSATDHPEAHLAYITKEEQNLLIKKDLYNSLKGKPNRGPGGIPSLQGDMGKTSGTAQGRQDPEGGYAPEHKYSKTAQQMSAQGPQYQTGRGKETTTGDGKKRSILDYSPTVKVAKFLYKGVKNIFQPKTEQQKVQANIDKGYDVHNPAEMHAAKKTYKDFSPAEDGANVARGTTTTQSLVTAPTADKAAGFGHQWNFQAYGANTQTAANPYDYTKTPYAKKGKMIRKYATGQEIKNFSKGKRFGPPPLKGPDSQGLQVILENSDYFKKLIG